MARGMIYEIENNPVDLGYMDIENFYENYPDCDGMQTVDGNDALQRVSDFVATLEEYGASVEGFNIPDEEAHAHPVLSCLLPSGFPPEVFRRAIQQGKGYDGKYDAR